MKTEFEVKQPDNNVPYGTLPTGSFYLNSAGSLLVKTSKNFSVLVVANGFGSVGDTCQVPENRPVTFVKKLEVHIE